jgi:hypothetical protein
MMRDVVKNNKYVHPDVPASPLLFIASLWLSAESLPAAEEARGAREASTSNRQRFCYVRLEMRFSLHILNNIFWF